VCKPVGAKSVFPAGIACCFGAADLRSVEAAYSQEKKQYDWQFLCYFHCTLQFAVMSQESGVLFKRMAK
jgi:hypothetical protein